MDKLLKTTTGIVAVYKEKGISSHDVIYRVRRITGIKKVGHAGTLDPLATGVLVVAIGREATKKIATEVKKEKEYLARIKLGFNSSTDDEEGVKEEIDSRIVPTKEVVLEEIKKFVGEIEQIPPIYSAIKVKGRKAYEMARKGKEIELKPRQVLIKGIEMISYEYPFLTLRVVTGPGVYIRALARDIGKVLGTGGYLTDLERSRVGEFTLNQALSVSS